MKIGYYIPTIKDLPVPGIDYRQKRYWQEGSQPIKWKSDQGLKFVESLFAEGNLSLPKYNSESCSNYSPSFKSLEDFFLFLKLSRTIKESDVLANSLSSDWSTNLPNRLLDLKKQISNSENNLLKDERFQTKLDTNIKLCHLQENNLRELIQNLEEKALALSDSRYYLLTNGLHSFWSLWNLNDEIQVRGFKLSEQIYEPGKLFSDLGYSHDALENDMKLLKVFNSEHRNNSNNSLNTFYKVIRTNDPKDTLYLSRERSKNNEEKIILVFRTHEILKKNSLQVDEHIRGSDNVYFNKFNTDPKTGIISLIVSNGRIGRYEEDKELHYGMLNIFDPKTGKGMTSDHPTIQHFEKVLVDNYVLEGYKLSDTFVIDSATGEKTHLRWVENGVMGKPCAACDLIPCDCQIILDWENYLDPSDSAQTGRPYWGFSRERYLELGISPNNVETEYYRGNPIIDNIPGRACDEMRYFSENIKDGDSGGLNWESYNDQLDMDQQNPEFWG